MTNEQIIERLTSTISWMESQQIDESMVVESTYRLKALILELRHRHDGEPRKGDRGIALPGGGYTETTYEKTERRLASLESAVAALQKDATATNDCLNERVVFKRDLQRVLETGMSMIYKE
jgi:hypothetical protein